MSTNYTRGRQTDRTVPAFTQLLLDNLYHTHGQSVHTASAQDGYMALSYSVRDFLVERWRRTTELQFHANPKFVYYFSAEYLPGRQLARNMLYTNTTDVARESLAAHDLKLDDFIDLDIEPGLGNGGLGRLASCFLDSLATLNIPAVGYGIRYEHGIFKQTFQDGWQVEKPDEWLMYGNPWEFPQPDEMVTVGFGGATEDYVDETGRTRARWVPAYAVLGEPCTVLVPGYATGTVNILRLWRARATEEFDFQLFDVGDYVKAVEQKIYSENISKVLYPNDETFQGKRLRLQQQYFFVACSLHDIVRRFHIKNDDWDLFPQKVVIQLNDTHPVIAIAELMRILVDQYELDWERAWQISRDTFAYTCHTLLPEALEKWPVDLLGHCLPRHLQIIYEINYRFLEEVRLRYPGDDHRLTRMSIIEETPQRQVRMAHLATVGSFAVNGVAELQSRLLREQTLVDFAELWPERFQNKTNGVTPRRFLQLANPRLADLISSAIGDGWLTDLEELRQLEEHADDAAFQRKWRDIKRANKGDLADYLKRQKGLNFNPDAVLDVLAKRLHEYKRQLLKAMHIIWLYQRIKANPKLEVVPRTFLFGAKAAPGYHMAKLIIKLIHNIGVVVNPDPDVHGRLKVVFPPNFNVSMAERIYPAADLSEQISLAGKEASGTGNMKFALNGAVTVGTLDGANVEIRDRVGQENFFMFGLTVEGVADLQRQGYNPMLCYQQNTDIRNVVDAIATGQFSAGDMKLFQPIVDSLLFRDQYMLLADFQEYVDCCEAAVKAYQDVARWTRMSILNTARCGFFSSDRAIREYCEQIWHVQSLPVP